MSEKKFSEAISMVDDKYYEEAIIYNHNSKATSVPHFRRLSTALIAAILALLLMGAGIAAVIYGDSIQNWFGHYWEEITGQPMSEKHIAVIDRLSQEIGVSQTVGGTTITVDSATVGDDNFFLLLKIDGMTFSDKYSYDFQRVDMETSPDPLKDGAFVGYGIDYLGLDGDGAALLLLNYEYASDKVFAQDSRPLQVWLTLQNLAKDAHTSQEEVLLEGDWYFSFAIDRSRPLEVISLPNIEIMAMVLDEQVEVPVTLTNIELTNTGLRFQFDHEQGTLSLSNQKISIILKNGNIIDNNGGIGNVTEGNGAMSFSCQWHVPVNLDEVSSVVIGGTAITVP